MQFLFWVLNNVNSDISGPCFKTPPTRNPTISISTEEWSEAESGPVRSPPKKPSLASTKVKYINVSLPRQDKTRQVYFRIGYIHILLYHRCWRLPPFRVSGSRTRQARMSSKICSGSRNSRKGSPASRVSPNRLLDHPLTLIPFRRRRTAFDGLGDRRQCEHPLGEQRPTGGVGMQALD